MSRVSYQHEAEIERVLENRRESFIKLGREYFQAFGYDKDKDRIHTQIRNLQQYVCSATRFSDIEDFIKNQMGKQKQSDTPREWLRVGVKSLNLLDALRRDARTLAGDSAEDALAIRLALARGWMRTVVSEYLFLKACDQMEDRPDDN